MLQTAAYGEVIAQNSEDQSRVVGLLEFSAGKYFYKIKEL
jgi:hypothetical protein